MQVSSDTVAGISRAQLYVGDLRAVLPGLGKEIAQAVITSPPYWGLRDYGLEPLAWGGQLEHAHEWGAELSHEFGRPQGQSGQRASRTYTSHGVAAGAFCECGAWRGSLGLEPTPELYVEHIVEAFRAVRLALKPDGLLWLNLGDSYAGSGNGSHDYRERNKNRSLSLNPDKYAGQSTRSLQRCGPQEHTEGAGRYKPKDLVMMPARLAMALQADGWWLRSQIPWLKRNSMPESVTDRPATAVEYVYLLSKSSRYFWDAGTVRMRNNDPNRTVFTPGKKQYAVNDTSGREMRNHGLGFGKSADGSGRNRRNSDWWFESWQGLLLDEQDAALAFIVNPAPLKMAHFASFPPKLVEPMVKASTRPGDLVLDPFCGAGTVGLVAARLGRDFIGIDLKASYIQMAQRRILDDAPMLNEVTI